jgi:hypothetical protein
VIRRKGHGRLAVNIARHIVVTMNLLDDLHLLEIDHISALSWLDEKDLVFVRTRVTVFNKG